MSKKYSQFRALSAIAKGSFKAMLRSPSAVVFTLAFPLIFVLVFGFIGNGGVSVRVGLSPKSDLNNPIVATLQHTQSVKLVNQESYATMLEDLKKGRMAAIMEVQDDSSVSGSHPNYTIQLYTSAASADKLPVFRSILEQVIQSTNQRLFHDLPTVAHIQTTELPGRAYKQIDFILPGMLGFSLLSTGVFGTAFLFFSLRQTLVLKRFFATPINKFNILLGEALARLVFQLLGALFLIAVGYCFFQFTLIHGLLTVIDMLILSSFGLIIFMGFGFIVSGIARNESTIPPIANIVTLPQFLLAGTFFPVDVFPGWLQPICKLLPLTYLNDALRKVAFEGAHLWNIPQDLLVLTGWGILVYLIAIKVFRWE